MRIKTIFSTLTEYKNYCAILKQKFIDNTDRKSLLREKEKNNKYRIPSLVTYKRKRPIICEIINGIISECSSNKFEELQEYISGIARNDSEQFACGI